MIRVSIKRNNVLTNQASFPTETEANEWFVAEKANHSFGKPAGLYKIEHLDGQELLSAISYEGDLVEIPDQFEVEFEDVSDLVAQSQTNIDSLAFLAQTDWKVMRHRDQLDAGVPTSMTNEEFQDLLVERQAARDSVVR